MKEEDGCKKSGRTAKSPWQNDKKREDENLFHRPLTTWDSQKPTAHLQIEPKKKWEAYYGMIFS